MSRLLIGRERESLATFCHGKVLLACLVSTAGGSPIIIIIIQHHQRR